MRSHGDWLVRSVGRIEYACDPGQKRRCVCRWNTNYGGGRWIDQARCSDPAQSSSVVPQMFRWYRHWFGIVQVLDSCLSNTLTSLVRQRGRVRGEGVGGQTAASPQHRTSEAARRAWPEGLAALGVAEKAGKCDCKAL